MENKLAVLAGCQRQLVNAGSPTCSRISQVLPTYIPVRTVGDYKLRRKTKEEEKKAAKKEKRTNDDKDKRKLYGKTVSVPIDDVYIKKLYLREVYDAMAAIDLLKHFQELDFTPLNQPVYIDLKLDMTLEKKKKVDPFVSIVHLPHPFKELNKVLVFTENPDQARVALDHGAMLAGGPELIEKILEDEITADFYVSVPEMVPKLTPLKNKLRKKFPKNKRGSVSPNIPNMMELFKNGHEYLVEENCYVRTQIATVGMPREHIFTNLQFVLTDVCSHRPASFGPFIERAIISSHTSEALWFKFEDFLPKAAEEQAAEEQAAASAV
ncbi:39S ribosomal protein L1, mitochondrial isoform X2 [Lampris incognitus]|uniref:39S ribosomal protein L1, mitochondrial isoform X2 n=1 Tax=Lampris incognitus TaxID=2546036 RepID=UPI0024B509A8|nr:39S ribosomal protein L1, mitochondrial isoform X2 [Lampris incognitus]